MGKGNPNIVKVGEKTRFPVNRKDHTQKGPYLSTILKRLLSSKWEFHDPKIKALVKKAGLEETIAVALVLRRILNGTEGDDTAIERIFDRMEGRSKESVELNGKGLNETKIIIINPPGYKKKEENGTNAEAVPSRLPV